MAYTTIDKPTDYFNTKLYTGNGGTQSITGVGFQPDWTWIKSRTTTNSHALYDAVRGATKTLRSNTTGAEATSSQSLTSFDSDGFSVGSDGQENGSGRNYASWNWKAGGSASSNTDGSITSTVSANTTSGFSIVSYSGSASNITVGHGLGVTPKMIIFKNRTSTSSWTVYHESIGNGHRLVLNSTGAKESTNQFSFGTSPTSSVFALGGGYGDVNTSGANYIAYCFAEKKGFSKFGSYTGNGNANGVFIYTGFKPAWVMCRDVENAAGWHIFDNKRPNAFNVINKRLEADNSDAENSTSGCEIDLVSNGFKFRGNFDNINRSGSNHIYMAFAESPFVSSGGIPTTAR